MNQLLRNLSAVTRLTLGYLALVLVGWALLCLPGFHRGEATASDHLFTATSALTTTGLSTVNLGDTYSFGGQLVTLLLLQIGGIGYMTVIGLFTIGHQYRSGEDEKMVQDDYQLPSGTDFRKFLLNVVRFTLAAELLGSAALSWAFAAAGVDDPLWNGIYVAISAFCTAGLELFANSLTDFRGNLAVNTVVSLLSLGGSFGFLFFTDLRERILGDRDSMKFTSQLMLRYMPSAILVTAAVLYFLEPTLQALPGADRLLAAGFQAVSVISTTGFSTVPVGGLAAGSVALFLIVMYVGGSPSGTGGGIKNTVFLTAAAAVVDRIRTHEHVTLLKKRLPEARVLEAVTVALATLALLVVLTVVLAYLQPGNIAATIFEATSAIGTVGLSRGMTTELTLAGKIIVCLLMFAGRIGTVSLVRAILNREG